MGVTNVLHLVERSVLDRGRRDSQWFLCFHECVMLWVHVNHFGGARHGNTARVIGEGRILFVGAEWRENTYVHCT